MKRLPILLLVLFILAGCGKTAVSTDLIRKNFIEEVASYHPGTAGSSLKQATAASNVLRFATEQKMRNADCKTAMERIQQMLEEEELERNGCRNAGVLPRKLRRAILGDHDSVLRL